MWEERGRALKAYRLVDAADELARKIGKDIYADANELADALARFPQPARTALAVSCGQRPPSEMTWSLVVARVRSRAEVVS